MSKALIFLAFEGFFILLWGMNEVLFVAFLVTAYLCIHGVPVWSELWDRSPVRNQAKELIHEAEDFLKGRVS